MDIEEKLKSFQNSPTVAIKLPETFIEDFVLLFKSGQFDDLIKFFRREYKGLFSKNEMDVTDRVLKHWENEKIIPANRTAERGWRKYSYLDQVWTVIVIHLRGFGYSLDSLKSVRAYLSHFQNEVNSEYPLLILFFAYAVSSGDIILLIVFDNGVAELTLKSDYIIALADGKAFPNHILINVTDIMDSIDKVFPEKKPTNNATIQQLNSKELKLINVYRKKEVTEILIKKNNNTEHITYTSKADPKNKAFFKGLGEIKYGNMAVQKSAGKVVDVKITNTEKL
jgi:DNA-binding transcriptional MerR regulator